MIYSVLFSTFKMKRIKNTMAALTIPVGSPHERNSTLNFLFNKKM